METDLRLESSLWVGNKRYRALLTGWYFNWTEVDKKNRDKKTSRWHLHSPKHLSTIVSLYKEYYTYFDCAVNFFACLNNNQKAQVECKHTQGNTVILFKATTRFLFSLNWCIEKQDSIVM